MFNMPHAIVVSLLCLLYPVLARANTRTINVLFLGNSLTYVADLPGTFERLSRSNGSVITVHSASSVQGGAILRDHSYDPSEYYEYNNIPHTIQKIRDGPGNGSHFDYVVIQDQSGSWFQLGPYHYDTYGFDAENDHRLFVDILTNETRAQGGEPIFLMTWRDGGAESLTDQFQAEVDDCYSYAASMTFSMCAPCGLAALRNKISGYGSSIYADMVHPTALTQYTNACVFYALLTNQSPVGLGSAGVSLGNNINMTVLQQNAWAAYNEYRNRRLPECNASRCIRFLDDDGELIEVPTATTTTTTSTTWLVPTAGTCSSQTEGEAVLSDSLLVNDRVADAVSPIQMQPVLERLNSVCASTWVPCYSGTRFEWGATFFHHCCDNKGPTLTVIKSGGRVFGGFAPVSWDSDAATSSTQARGGFLWRVVDTSAEAQIANLTSPSNTVMHDTTGYCVWLGKWQDLMLGNDCRTASNNFVYDGYTDVPDDFDDYWLTNSTSWVADEVEVFYSPELAESSTFNCQAIFDTPTFPPTSTAPTSPTFPQPTASPSLPVPTGVPSKGPSLFPTPQPSLAPTGFEGALGRLEDGSLRIVPVSSIERYLGFLDMRIVVGGSIDEPETEWTAVCDTGFTSLDAQVACQSMGLSGGEIVTTGLRIPDDALALRNEMSSFVSDFECSPWTYFLRDCPHLNSVEVNRQNACNTSHHVVITCEAPQAFDIRLTPDPSLNNNVANGGILEVYIDNPSGIVGWYSICASGWDSPTPRESLVVCQQLGYSHGQLDQRRFQNISAYGLGSIECIPSPDGSLPPSFSSCTRRGTSICPDGPIAIQCEGFMPPLTTSAPNSVDSTAEPSSGPIFAPVMVPTKIPTLLTTSPTPSPVRPGPIMVSKAPSVPLSHVPSISPTTVAFSEDLPISQERDKDKSKGFTGPMMYVGIIVAVAVVVAAITLFVKGRKLAKLRKVQLDIVYTAVGENPNFEPPSSFAAAPLDVDVVASHPFTEPGDDALDEDVGAILTEQTIGSSMPLTYEDDDLPDDVEMLSSDPQGPILLEDCDV